MLSPTVESGQPRGAGLGAIAALVWRALLLGIPVAVVLFAVFVVTAARSNSLALDFEAASELGDRAANALDAYIAHLVEDARILADTPAVRAAATARPANRPDPAQTKNIDAAWIGRRAVQARTPVHDRIDEILEKPVSRDFNELCAKKTRAVREVLLTDEGGRLVAASGPTENYDQHEEEWWIQAVHKSASCERPRDCSYGSDVKLDHSVGAMAFDLAVPVFEPESRATGVLKLVFDPGEMRQLLALARGNHPVRVALIRRDGTAVFPRDDAGDGTASRAATNPLADAEGKVPPEILDDLSGIGTGQQITLKVEGAAIPVRGLTGPHAGTWAVAVFDDTERPHRASVQIFALVAIIAGMFLLSVRAYALLLRGLRTHP